MPGLLPACFQDVSDYRKEVAWGLSKNQLDDIALKFYPKMHLAPDYNVVENTRGICSGTAWHGERSACPCQKKI